MTTPIHNSDFCIIGAGKLGLSIAEYFVGAGIKFSIIARSEDSYNKSIALLDSNLVFRAIDQLFYVPRTFIITVRDNQIREVAEYLSKIFKSNLQNKVIFHCSGIIKSDELDSCRQFEAITASLHPYQTFFKPSANLLKGISWGVETDFNTDIFNDFIRFIEGTPITINKLLKEMYHLSAVSMSNYLNSAITLGVLASEQAGIKAIDFATPIINQTVDNALLSNHKQHRLTGPIARADLETIKIHINVSKDYPDILIPYCYMGLATLELAKSSGISNPEFYTNARLLFLNAISENKKY